MKKTIEINGYKLEVGSISPLAPKALENRYRKFNPEPERPFYTVEAVGGIEEKFFHSRETVTTDEEIKALEEYEQAFTEWNAGLTFKLLRLFLSLGVEPKLTKGQEKDFEEKLETLEIELPESKSERNLFYLETFILSDQEAMEKVIQTVLDVTGINSDAIKAAEDTFPV